MPKFLRSSFLVLSLFVFSFFFITPTVYAKTEIKTVKKAQTVKKPVVVKKVVKKPAKPVKKIVVKKVVTKKIPMTQLPNPNSATSTEMKLYLKTINDARLTYKKEQTKAKTKEAKQTAEDKYAQAVQDAMNLLNKPDEEPKETSAYFTD